MSRWWRAYDEAVDDPKLLLLSDKQHRTWFNLMCVASAYGGVLPDIKIVALKLRMTPAKAQAAIDELQAAILIDDIDGKLQPHNWNGRQYKSDVTDPTNATRQKRYRERHANAPKTVTDTVTVTPPRVQNTETDSETEPERKIARTRAWPAHFDQFWQAFPNKVGKDAARKAFERIEKSGRVSIADLMLGLDRYVHKTDDRPWCNPATWLNQGRWDDQPAAGVQQNGQGKSILSTIERVGQSFASGDDYPEDQADLLRLPAR